MLRDIEVDEPATIVRQNDEDIQDSQTNRRDCEETSSKFGWASCLSGSIVKPSARKSQSRASATPHGCAALPRWDWPQPWFAPTCESPDTLVDVLTLLTGTISTVAFESLPLPSGHRFRLNEYERSSP